MPRLKAPPAPQAESPPELARDVTPEPESERPLLAKAVKTVKPVQSVDEFGFADLDDTIDYLKVLFYGREGTAKTTGAAAAVNVAPPSTRVLVVNAEGGLKKVALQRRGIDTSRIAVWPNPASGVTITSKTLTRLHDKLLADLTANPGCWFAVVVDSITDVHQALRVQATNKRIATQLANPRVDNSLVDEDFVDRDDYGVMTNQLREWLRDMRDLPCHVIFTALERLDDKTGMIGPAVTPALATDLLGYVDVTAYMRATLHATGEDDGEELAEFRALTRPGKTTRAKDRFDLTPRVLATPTFERLLGYIQGDLEENSDPVQAAYVARRAAEAQAKAEAAKKAPAKKVAAKKAGARAASADSEEGITNAEA